MRLIDVDALLNRMQEDPLFDLVERYGVSGVINAEPTAEAIPIEYINNQIGRWERSKCESYHAICYRHLIEEWKMENERKEE